MAAEAAASVPDVCPAASGCAGFGHGFGRVFLELAGVGVEAANAFTELLDRHLILVVLEAKALFVEVDQRAVAGLGALGRELGLELAVFAGKGCDQIGADGEEITACQIDDLFELAKARAHDLGLVAVLLVVVVDAEHAGYARIFFTRDVGDALRLLVPVVNAPDERRDQGDLGLGAGDRLGEAEEQGQVGVNALFFQLFSGFDALPSGAELDQHALALDSGSFVQLDEVARLVDAAIPVEAEARVDLGRDTTGDQLQDLAAEIHEQLVHEGNGLGFLIARLLLGIAQRLFHEVLVLRLLCSLEQERRVGGRVLRLGFADSFDVAGIGYHGRVLLQRIEQRHRNPPELRVGWTWALLCARVERGACPPPGASATAGLRDASAPPKRLLEYCSKVAPWPVDQCANESSKPSAALGSIGRVPQDIVLTGSSYPTYSGECVGACAFAQAEMGTRFRSRGCPAAVGENEP